MALSNPNSKVITLSKTTWGSKLEKLNDREINSIAEHITLDGPLEFEMINKVTSKIAIYRYGPLLTFLEVEQLCKQLVEGIPELREHYNQLFYQFFNILMPERANEYTLKNKNVMIINEPYCLVISVGSSTLADYVIDLGKKICYHLSVSPFGAIQYKEEFFKAVNEFYKDGLEKYIDRQLLRIQAEYSSFEEEVNDRIANNLELVKQNEEKIMEHENRKHQLMEEINKIKEERRKKQLETAAQTKVYMASLKVNGDIYNKEGTAKKF